MTTAADLIKRFEGCRLHAYPDPATGGKPYTVGWGCTGPGIGPDTVWTQAEADAALEHRLSALQSVVRDLCPTATEQQSAALCSLGWNIGTDHLATSEVVKHLNAGDVQAAADAFLHWERAGGNPHFLQHRREAERAIFLGTV